jgi:NADH dehydrogenase
VERFCLISAIGADPQSPSMYARTKAQGEAGVLDAFPTAAILRPSIVFGPEDQFFNRFAAMARFTPALPVVGAETRFQPVYVEDVAEAAARVVTGEAPAKLYELGGPDVATFRELMALMLKSIRRKRLIVEIPGPLARLQGRVFEVAARFGLTPPITLDQVRLLERDNVVAADAPGLPDLGVTPTAMASVMDSYLYPYRPYGQYSDIGASSGGAQDKG